MESPKSWSLTDNFRPKNRLLQLKHYIQRIYLSLLSTTYVKIHQIASVICETKSSLLRHNFSVFFSSNITYFLQKQPIKEHIFRLATARVKVHQIPDDIFQIKSQFFFQSLNFSVSWKIILLYFFSWNAICFWQRQQINVQIFRLATARIKILRILHVIFGNKRKESVFLQTLHHSSLSWDITLLYFLI